MCGRESVGGVLQHGSGGQDLGARRVELRQRVDVLLLRLHRHGCRLLLLLQRHVGVHLRWHQHQIIASVVVGMEIVVGETVFSYSYQHIKCSWQL